MQSSVPFYQRYPTAQHFIFQGKSFSAGWTSQERLEKIPDFEVRQDDVCLVNYPKTGTRWTSEILLWIYHDANEEKIQTVSNTERCPYLEVSQSFELNTMNNIAALPSTKPRLYGTHLPFNMAPRQLAEKGKIICLLRNPKDSAVSYYHFYRMLKSLGPYEGPLEDFLQGFSRGETVFGSYFDFVNSWWERRHQTNILFVRYEEMKREPAAHVRKIAEFLGKSFSEEMVDLIVEKSSLKTMSNHPSLVNYWKEAVGEDTWNGVERKGKGEVGDWKNYLTVAQNEEFDKLIEEKFQGTGLVFEY